jgi:hypothetical protein
MENSNPEELRQWVASQTTYLDPPSDWQPDAAAARARFHARVRARRWRSWAIAAAVIAGVLLLVPVGRVVAQQLWQMLTVKQVAFIRVNSWPEGVPSPKVNLIGNLVPPIPVRDVAAAQWVVHYSPRLPVGTLNGTPRLATAIGMSAGTVIHVADLQMALRKTGVTDQTVPPQWDGAQIALHTSGAVIAEWPDIRFAQSLPPTITAPPGFDFPAFSALVLRILGVAPDEAQRLAQRMGTTPYFLAPIDRDFEQRATIEEITLNSGPATLVQQQGWKNDDPKTTTVIWSVPDRVYVLTGKLSRELAILAANSVQ